jgi:hypothetical protein
MVITKTTIQIQDIDSDTEILNMETNEDLKNTHADFPIYTTTDEELLEKNKKNALEWFLRCVSSEHAILSLILCFFWIIFGIPNKYIMGNSAGYFIFDLTLMISNYKDIDGLVQTLLHHFAGKK